MAKQQQDSVAFVQPHDDTRSTDWSLAGIRAAERLANYGDLRAFADLCDWVRADPKASGALQARVSALLGLPITFEASGDRRSSRRVIKALEAGEDWWKLAPEHTLRALLSWAVLAGVGLAQLVYRVDDETGRMLPTLEVWHLRHLRWDRIARQWLVRVRSSSGLGTHEVVATPGDGRWIFLAPDGLDAPWDHGVARAASRWRLLKEYATYDWGDYSGRVGRGTWVVEPASPSRQQDRRALADELANLGRDGVVVPPPAWKANLIEIKAGTEGVFKAQTETADSQIVFAIQGTDFSTKSDGTYGKAAVLNGVRWDLIGADAEALSTAMHDQVLRYWAEFNFGSPALAPWPTWPTDPPEDADQVGQAYKSLGEGLAALTAIDTGVDVRQVLVDAGVPIRADAPDQAEPPAPPPAPAAPAAPDAAPPAADAPPAKGAKGMAHLRATSARLQGRAHADQVATNGAAIGARVMGPTLAAVLAAIDSAEDWDSLQRALPATLAHMQLDELAGLLRRSMVLGNMGGRYAVLREAGKGSPPKHHHDHHHDEGNGADDHRDPQ